MANNLHINLLRQGFKVWNKWRKLNPLIPKLKGANLTGLNLFKVDLSGADLSEVDFSKTSLYKANLSGANLYKANLSTAILQEADLSKANLIEANLKDKKFPQTNLSGANLTRANLNGVKFYAHTNLNQTNFSLSNFSRVDFSGLNLRGSNFTGANLYQANLSTTNLNGTNFSSANLSGANLEHANLREAQIQEATIDEKWYLVWDIVNNGVEGRELQGLDLSMADLEEANLCEADLSRVDFTRTKLNGANLAKSILVKANFCEADLRGADLRGADLRGANLNYTKLHRTQIQGAIIDQKWYLVWDIVNNGAEERDLTEADLSEADLSEANFKNGNLSRVDFSSSILNRADLSWTDLSRVNFTKANLAGANFNWADLNNADLSEVQGFDSIICSGANFNCASFRQIKISSDSLHVFREKGASFDEADFSEANILISITANAPVRNKKEFFESLLSWKNQESLNESIKKSFFSSEKSLIPGILLYTDEDEKLSLYVRKHFDALDKLTGDWCTIYLLENPSPKWRQANHNWRRMIESGLDLNWFRSKPYDKSEAYDIARQLNVELSNLPCLVLISPENLSERLVFEIQEVSASYFRKLFSTIEKLVKNSKVKKTNQNKVRSQVFEHIKINFNEIVGFLEKNATKDEKNSGVKYFFKSNNLSVYVEPVNIENVNYTNQSRSLTVGDVGVDFKPIASSFIADDLSVSGTVAESIDFDQSMPKGVELQNRQEEKTLSQTSKSDESKSILKFVVIIVICFAFLAGVAAYIFFQLGLSRNPVPRPSQEQSAM
ncbi:MULTISPECIES: pentapeptide repeat-containing protein [Moorena]|uniref:Uncharacterized low-complexity protein n=1 Tax=Moorena producens 3L TaxID=489825 RepID=F4XV80_9CYAN|nr:MULTISPECIES: pentapeptide repeat-containing protein [Moorena]EGJ31428.1 uncharacterized low-complexity protein [Moorena producens 3L]NEP66421.1 hypothetical protein [Moorena sp. SIO3A5]NES43820.1 hypothetical protein [Moorena sp. SIO2C4]OLT68747.1 hypothetical protein BI334_30400 [Moorena producens 3L]